MKQVIVIYFDDDWAKEAPIPSDPALRRSFEDWHQRGLAQGIAMFRASIQWYDESAGVFTKAWAYRDQAWKKITTPIKPDLVFDSLESGKDYQYFELKKKIAGRTKIYNEPLFRTLLDNKLSQYLIFREFMPCSAAINNPSDWDAVRGQFEKRVAVKPLYGSGGVGIEFVDPAQVQMPAVPCPALIQQFISSTRGIPGFSGRPVVADLRLIYIDHHLIFALSREAKAGSLFTNYHMGAVPVRVPLEKIPASIQTMAGRIIDILKIYPRANYSLDFIFDDQGRPFLMEMNTTPGTSLLEIIGDEDLRRRYFEFCIVKHL